MLRLLILFLILRGATATSEDVEGTSSGDNGDDEEYEDVGLINEEMHTKAVGTKHLEIPEPNPGTDKSRGDGEANEGGTLIIIIATVSIVALIIGTVVAIVLFRRYLQSREQGVYSVPAEQGQKAAV